MSQSSQSSLASRLEFILPEALDENAARALLLEPIVDLGFEVSDPDTLVEAVFRLTGRLPHLIQFCGEQLALLAIKAGSDSIPLAYMDRIKSDFQTVQYFASPLMEDNLKTPELRFVALAILEKAPEQISIPEVQALVAKESIFLEYLDVVRICNELVINNVLIWNNGTFRIVNEALPDYARQLGFLSAGLVEARRVLKAKYQSSSPRVFV